MISPLARATGAHIAASLDGAARHDDPYRFWLLHDVLPAETLSALRSLRPATPQTLETAGRRETNNASRIFFDAAMRALSPHAEALAVFLQSSAALRLWRDRLGLDLAGSFLRIEYCQDMAGFWLEPHTDIGAKFLTLLIYLADPPAGECWGTDILRPDHTLALRASGAANTGVLFIPGHDTWHGFGPRPISGVRRTLIINYVTPDWRARHELAYPDDPLS